MIKDTILARIETDFAALRTPPDVKIINARTGRAGRIVMSRAAFPVEPGRAYTFEEEDHATGDVWQWSGITPAVEEDRVIIDLPGTAARLVRRGPLSSR